MKPRTVMMQTGTLIPELARVEARPYWRSWEEIQSANGDRLEHDLRKAGWNFFFLADTMQAVVWGRGGETIVRRAVRRVLARAKSLRFNCVEITEITQKRFLVFPYVRVTAHSRHIQRSSTMQSLLERNQAEAAATWAVG
jgi:hypothetical protein